MEKLENRYIGPDRIIGTDEDIEKYLKLLIAQRSLREEPLASFEREQTVEEFFIITRIFDKMPDFIKEYGAEEARYIPLEKIRIIDEKLPQHERPDFLKEKIIGQFRLHDGNIHIVSDPSKLVEFAHALVHELIHAHSFFSVTFNENGEGTAENPLATFRRFGLSIKSDEQAVGKNPFFHFMNEALTEELTKRFCEKYFPGIAELKDEFEVSNTYQRNPDMPDTPFGSFLKEFFGREFNIIYPNDRAKFIAILQVLYERNRDTFKSYEDVFKLFSRAMFQGGLLSIARLIEKTFGKGSFRGLGKETQDTAPNLLDILQSISKSEPDNK